MIGNKISKKKEYITRKKEETEGEKWNKNEEIKRERRYIG